MAVTVISRIRRIAADHRQLVAGTRSALVAALVEVAAFAAHLPLGEHVALTVVALLLDRTLTASPRCHEGCAMLIATRQGRL
jgi:hypothetical protein